MKELADTKHMRAARAIVKGLSAQLKDSHRKSRPFPAH